MSDYEVLDSSERDAVVGQWGERNRRESQMLIGEALTRLFYLVSFTDPNVHNPALLASERRRVAARTRAEQPIAEVRRYTFGSRTTRDKIIRATRAR